MDGEWPTPRSYEEARRQMVEAELSQWEPVAEGQRRRYSAYGEALDAITKGGVEYARAKSVPFNDHELDEILQEGVDVIQSLRFAFHEDRDPKSDFSLWHHRANPLGDIKEKAAPYIDRHEVEATVGWYLKLPYRASAIDRLFVDLLVAMELYAYGQETVNADAFLGNSVSPLKQRPLLNFAVNIVFTVVVWMVLVVTMWGFNALSILPSDWFAGLAGVLAFLGFLSIAWSALYLPRAMWAVHKGRRKVLDLLNHMHGVYMDLRSNGPISPSYVESRAKSAAEAGVCWPAPLFALLEDIKNRNATF